MQRIIHIKQFLSKGECAFLTEFFLRKSLIEGGVYNTGKPSLNYDQRRCLTSYHKVESEISWLDDRVNAMFRKLAVLWKVGSIETIEDLKFVRYKKGHHFLAWHQDRDDLEASKRVITYTGMLSNINDYSGGQIEISPMEEVQKYDLELGDFLFFSSHYLHRVTEVTAGQRDVIVNWTSIKEC